jgi:hypothetical protein
MVMMAMPEKAVAMTMAKPMTKPVTVASTVPAMPTVTVTSREGLARDGQRRGG